MMFFYSTLAYIYNSLKNHFIMPRNDLDFLDFLKDTLKSPPSENKTMKKASLYGIGVTSIFYVSIGCIGYAAFGNDAPGNLLTGFYEPFWLVDLGNIAVLIHLVGAYQVIYFVTSHSNYLLCQKKKKFCFNKEGNLHSCSFDGY
jgi:Transmembrane amino acid transporter protein